MIRVFVLYPAEFLAESKFSRKLGKLLSRLEDVTLLYVNDHNKFIERYVKDSGGGLRSECLPIIEDAGITHAIIFDDGEEFKQEKAAIEELEIPIRVVGIAITRVVNITRDKQYQGIKSTLDYEYIGRGSYWGNPYSMFDVNTEDGMDDRDEVIRKYRYDFDKDLFPNKSKTELPKLAGKRLGCFCSPAVCHGDVLAEYLNSLDDGD
jgi:hypothetical protein